MTSMDWVPDYTGLLFYTVGEILREWTSESEENNNVSMINTLI